MSISWACSAIDPGEDCGEGCGEDFVCTYLEDAVGVSGGDAVREDLESGDGPGVCRNRKQSVGQKGSGLNYLKVSADGFVVDLQKRSPSRSARPPRKMSECR